MSENVERLFLGKFWGNGRSFELYAQLNGGKFKYSNWMPVSWSISNNESHTIRIFKFAAKLSLLFVLTARELMTNTHRKWRNSNLHETDKKEFSDYQLGTILTNALHWNLFEKCIFFSESLNFAHNFLRFR